MELINILRILSVATSAAMIGIYTKLFWELYRGKVDQIYRNTKSVTLFLFATLAAIGIVELSLILIALLGNSLDPMTLRIINNFIVLFINISMLISGILFTLINRGKL